MGYSYKRISKRARNILLIIAICLLSIFMVSFLIECANEPQMELDDSEISIDSVQYVRTHSYTEHASSQILLLQSLDEVDSYYEKEKDYLDLERREVVPSDSTIGFKDACDRYTEGYFSEHNLLLVRLSEPSGSIRHEVEELEHIQDDEYKLVIRKILPDIGTTDIAEWILLIEVDKLDLDTEKLQIEFLY